MMFISDCMPWIYLSEREQINTLQRMVIVHSIIYYELDSSVISDKDFDTLAKQLVKRQKTFDVSKTQYGYCMKDFDGTTGFDLYSKLRDGDKMYLRHIAEMVLENYRKESKSAERTD